jgi:hypothetical protein
MSFVDKLPLTKKSLLSRQGKIATFFLILASIKYFRYLPVSMFEADQEYLALSTKRILAGDLTLIGAPTSVGGMFIGPLYNYLTTAVMWFFQGSPYVINGLSFFWASLTIPALYLLGTKLVSERAGIFTATIALISTNFLNHVQIPPLLFPLPLISLLFIFVAEASIPRSKKSLLLGVLTGLSLNLHFSGVFFIPLLLFFGWRWILSLVALLLPLGIFEIRNNFLMIKQLVIFFSENTGVGTSVYYRLNIFDSGLFNMISPVSVPPVIAIVGLFLIIFLVVRSTKSWLAAPIVTPAVFFLLYSGHLLPYYSIIAWSAFLLSLGVFTSKLWGKHPIFKVSFIVTGLWLMNSNLNVWINWTSRRSIDKKFSALAYIKDRSQGQQMYISRTIELAANSGFDYLIPYMDLKSTGNPNDTTYTIVIPANWQGITPDVQFGDIGVVLPSREQTLP